MTEDELDDEILRTGESMQAEIERLKKQLPEGMEHCTIQFRECEKGHGWLTATNWVQHGCPTCEIERLRAALIEYGLHKWDCPCNDPSIPDPVQCNCGFSALAH